MESLIALIIAAICTVGSFYVGASYGREKAYDKAFEDAARSINEVYEEMLKE